MTSDLKAQLREQNIIAAKEREVDSIKISVNSNLSVDLIQSPQNSQKNIVLQINGTE